MVAVRLFAFKWFVFFDKDTPEIYKNRIQKIANNFPNFIPVYIQDITFLNYKRKKYAYSQNYYFFTLNLKLILL